MDTMTLVFSILVVMAALGFSFSTGYNEPNVAAVVISTKAISPRKALFVVGVLEFLGACVLGTTVAKTFAVGIIDPSVVSHNEYGMVVVLITLLVATGWNVVCTIFGFPISASMALVGGFVGAGIAAAGFIAVQWSTVLIIFGLLIMSPFMGFFLSYIVTKLAYLAVRRAKPVINQLIITLEIIITLGLALVTGANAAQRPMGIIVFSLISAGILESSTGGDIPLWVVLTCGLALGVGIISTGNKVLRTVGRGYYRVRHINGLSAQLASAGIIQVANFVGMPVSTTQVTSSSVLGTGAAERIKTVRWNVGIKVLSMWFITMPATAIISYLVYLLVTYFLSLMGV
ncbi:MAG: inorganic phosphate transporter [Dehalococcoidales bacterium]|nr:inorganic phosphate transporter [Dehalococcoidales bacterium]